MRYIEKLPLELIIQIVICYHGVCLLSLPAATTGKFIRLWLVSSPLSGALSGRSSSEFQSIQDNQALPLCK